MPVHCGTVLVYPGDSIYADYDGIVVIPKAIEKEVIHKAREKVHAENLSREELLNGESLREVYNNTKHYNQSL